MCTARFMLVKSVKTHMYTQSTHSVHAGRQLNNYADKEKNAAVQFPDDRHFLLLTSYVYCVWMAMFFSQNLSQKFCWWCKTELVRTFPLLKIS